MNTLVLHLERSNDGAVVHDYVAGEPWQDGSIFGRFMNLSEETLKPFVEPSKEGKLYTLRPGHKYKVTGLTVEGNFKLVPYCQPS